VKPVKCGGVRIAPFRATTPRYGALPGLLQPIENDRHRTVVDERHLHASAERTATDANSCSLERPAELLVERPRMLGPRSVGETRPVSLAGSAMSVNWLTTRASPPTSTRRSNVLGVLEFEALRPCCQARGLVQVSRTPSDQDDDAP
jgi:hypothetical protein